MLKSSLLLLCLFQICLTSGMETEKEKIAMQSEHLLKTRLESEGFAEFVQVTKIHEQLAHQRMHPYEVFEKVTEAIKTYNNYLQKKGLNMENPQLASLMFNHRKFILQLILKEHPQALKIIEDIKDGKRS